MSECVRTGRYRVVGTVPNSTVRSHVPWTYRKSWQICSDIVVAYPSSRLDKPASCRKIVVVVFAWIFVINVVLADISAPSVVIKVICTELPAVSAGFLKMYLGTSDTRQLLAKWKGDCEDCFRTTSFVSRSKQPSRITSRAFTRLRVRFVSSWLPSRPSTWSKNRIELLLHTVVISSHQCGL